MVAKIACVWQPGGAGGSQQWCGAREWSILGAQVGRSAKEFDLTWARLIHSL